MGRPVQTRFRFGSPTLNLARHQQLAGPLCKKYALTVLVRYRSPLVFSLAGWSPRIRSGFHVSGSTQVPTWESHDFRLRASNPLRTDIPDRSATRAFCNSQAALRDDQVGP